MDRQDKEKLDAIVKNLVERGLIESLPDGKVRMTEKGRDYAEKNCCCQQPCKCNELYDMK